MLKPHQSTPNGASWAGGFENQIPFDRRFPRRRSLPTATNDQKRRALLLRGTRGVTSSCQTASARLQTCGRFAQHLHRVCRLTEGSMNISTEFAKSRKACSASAPSLQSHGRLAEHLNRVCRVTEGLLSISIEFADSRKACSISPSSLQSHGRLAQHLHRVCRVTEGLLSISIEFAESSRTPLLSAQICEICG
jgi:hypothetical protein